MTQPEALRLADVLDRSVLTVGADAAAELRRLYQLTMDQQGEIYALQMARSMEQKTAKLKQAVLLEALKELELLRMQSLEFMPPEIRGAWMRAHAAIAKAEGEKT